MYLAGFSLNNLSLMALTVATGFVVDDAIVVLENIVRHVEDGMSRLEAALLGAQARSASPSLSISISLVAVFIPLLFMGGIVGRLFREFAVTMSAAVLISLVISLTTTPMIAALLLKEQGERRPDRVVALDRGGVRPDDPRLWPRASNGRSPTRRGPADAGRRGRHQRLSCGRRSPRASSPSRIPAR